MATSIKDKPAKASRGLGKGLSALMSESYSQTATPTLEKEVAQRDGAPVILALEEIQPGEFQPRDHFDKASLLELTESIRLNGVVQPILVRRHASGKYEIIAGERRWRAAGMAGQKHIPAIVRNFDDKKALEIALVENIQREDLNPLEEAAGYLRLVNDFGYTQEELAQTVHKSRSHIANLMRLLELPEEIRALLQEDKLTMGHARALFGVPNAGAVAQEIIHKGLNVRQTEKLARLSKSPGDGEPRKRKTRGRAAEEVVATTAPTVAPVVQPAPLPEAPRFEGPRDPDIVALEATLSETLGLKVRINDRGQSGEITILYEALEQLDDILRRLGGSI